jgi:hypothetical protein
MTRARPTPRALATAKSKTADDIAHVAEPRKRPWLLALAIVLLSAWFALLAALAWRG